MNRLDYTKLLNEVNEELSEPNGTFESLFGRKTEEERKEMEYIAAVALVAVDRYYSGLTRLEFSLREMDEKQG